MHRVRITLFTLIFVATSAASAQTEGNGAPSFHAGQWAARFQIASGFEGVGALHFSTPSKAWVLAGHVDGGYVDHGAPDQNENNQAFGISVGERWYRAAAARVRPFGGLGVSGNFSRSHQVSGANSATDLTFGGSVYGELGATIFFAPELSLGAAWSADFGVSRGNSYVNGGLSSHSTYATLGGGAVVLEGAFYF